MKKLFLFYFFSFVHIAATEVPFKSTFEQLSSDFFKKNNLAGISVVVVKGDEATPGYFSEIFTYGFADRSKRILMKPSTFLKLGTLSRLFVSIEYSKLLQLGKILENEHVQEKLPKTFYLPKHGNDQITFKDLVLHESGLPHLPSIPMKRHTASRYDIQTYFSSQKLNKKPGSIEIDSDLGYAVLAYALSCVSGEDFCDRIDSELVSDAGIKESGYQLDKIKRQKLATGYKGLKPVVTDLSDRPGSFFYPVTGFIANSSDLLLLLKYLVSPKSSGLASLFKAEATKKFIVGTKKALSWECAALSPSCSLATYRMDSVYQGFSASIAVIPDTKCGLVVVSNTEENLKSFITKLLEALHS